MFCTPQKPAVKGCAGMPDRYITDRVESEGREQPTAAGTMYLVRNRRNNASQLVHEVIREAFLASDIEGYIQNVTFEDQPPRWQTWGLGFTVVSACSYSAPLGILLLPCFSKSVYERIMTFLIALGIGALSSNALFIMIPQAFTLNTLEQFAYRNKSGIILSAIYIFFAVDRLLQYMLEFKRRHQVRRKVHASTLKSLMGKPKFQVDVRNATEETTVPDHDKMSKKSSDAENGDVELRKREEEVLAEEVESAVISNALVRTFSQRRRVAVVKALDDVEFQDKNGHTAHLSPNFGHRTPNSCRKLSRTSNGIGDDKVLPPISESTQKENREPDVKFSKERRDDDEVSVSVQIVEKHVLEPAAIQVASVAYMLIFGSSANNFVDGMSMGAAFSDSIMRGLSIGIAVISQQFPQELGTLAILIKSGLGLKRALLLNMVPIILSYIGFAVGVILDNVDDSYDEYVFAVSSGMYLYIFLGTLIPEMRESTNEIIKTNLLESIYVTIIQIAGIGSGVALMTFMSSISEDDLT